MSEYIYEKISKNEPIRICEVTEAEHPDGDGAFFAQVNSKASFYHINLLYVTYIFFFSQIIPLSVQNSARDPGEFNDKLNGLVEADQFEKLRISSTGETERPSVGMHVVAQFREDELWYRAEVIKVSSEVQYIQYYRLQSIDSNFSRKRCHYYFQSNPRGIKIAFIDYGNEEDIAASDLQDCVRKTSPEICIVPAFAYRVRDNTLYENPAAGKNALESVYGAMSAHHGEECDLAVLDIWRFIPCEDKEQTRYASNVDFWGELQCRLGENFKWTLKIAPEINIGCISCLLLIFTRDEPPDIQYGQITFFAMMGIHSTINTIQSIFSSFRFLVKRIVPNSICKSRLCTDFWRGFTNTILQVTRCDIFSVSVIDEGDFDATWIRLKIILSSFTTI